MAQKSRTKLSIKIDFLVAYPYLRSKSTMNAARSAVEAGHRLWLDSGAFTTYKAGGQPTAVSDYVSFIRGLDFPIERIFTLDVVGDPAATKRNHDRLLDEGIRPVPIFTPGTPLNALDVMYQTSDLVAVGGINTNKGSGGGGPGWAKYVLEHEARPIHLLGFINKPIIAKYKPYSVDASSWTFARRTGQIDLYIGRGKNVILRRTEMASGIKSEQIDAIKAYSASVNELRKESSWRGGYSVSSILNGRSSIRLMLDIRSQFATRYVFACAGGSDLNEIILAAKIESQTQ